MLARYLITISLLLGTTAFAGLPISDEWKGYGEVPKFKAWAAALNAIVGYPKEPLIFIGPSVPRSPGPQTIGVYYKFQDHYIWVANFTPRDIDPTAKRHTPITTELVRKWGQEKLGEKMVALAERLTAKFKKDKYLK